MARVASFASARAAGSPLVVPPPLPSLAVPRFRRRACAARLLACSLLGATSLVAARPAAAQQPAPADTLAEARRLRDARDFAAALAQLEAWVAAHPDDAVAARLRAETLYWLGERRAAGDAYAAAFARWPDDPALRHEYGRFLVETGQARAGRAVLAPLLGRPDMLGRAEALLGTAAYWAGDLVSARRLLSAALAADANQPDVRRLLEDVHVGAAPWAQVGAELRHDDQPLDRRAVDAAAGWFATPLLGATLRAGLAGLDADAVAGAPGLARAEGELSHYAPAARLESMVAAGVVRRSLPSRTEWTGRAMLGLRLPNGVALRGRAAREPYLRTAASLVTPVTTTTLGGELAWNHPRGWLGEAAVQRERYPDDNAVTTAYAWLLAPVARGARGVLRLGWGASAQDADESRFVLVHDVPSGPGVPVEGVSTEGHYAPYWTPSRLRAHSVLAAAELRPGAALVLRAGGSYGVSAREDAPYWTVVNAGPPEPPGPPGPPGPPVPPAAPLVERRFAERTFHPLELRASADVALGRDARLVVRAEHQRAAFWAGTTVGAGITWRFAAGARRRAAAE